MVGAKVSPTNSLMLDAVLQEITLDVYNHFRDRMYNYVSPGDLKYEHLTDSVEVIVFNDSLYARQNGESVRLYFGFPITEASLIHALFTVLFSWDVLIERRGKGRCVMLAEGTSGQQRIYPAQWER